MNNVFFLKTCFLFLKKMCFFLLCITTHRDNVLICKNVMWTRWLIYTWVRCTYMQECSVHSLIQTFIPMGAMYWHAWISCDFCTHWCNVMQCIFMQERSVHSLRWLLYPQVQCVYQQARSVCPQVSSVTRYVSTGNRRYLS